MTILKLELENELKVFLYVVDQLEKSQNIKTVHFYKNKTLLREFMDIAVEFKENTTLPKLP